MVAPDAPEPSKRFDDRVEDYAKYRPSYPAALLKCFRSDMELAPSNVVADLGSGTGILSKVFIDNGNEVYGIEPNAAMREAAETYLHGFEGFHSVSGSAEATTLDDVRVDFVVAGQAFHWFDTERAHVEFVRILKPGGWCALIWNNRRLDATPFLREYESFLMKWGTDYREVRVGYGEENALRAFFHGARYQIRSFDNEQIFDRDGLRGRLMSSSYIPSVDSPQFTRMIDALDELFDRHQESGKVRFEYDTKVYYGKLSE